MDLSHFSPEIISTITPIEVVQEINHKPHGFWLSVDGEQDWRDWCEAEEFRLERLRFRHKIELASRAKILHISNPLELINFTNEYRGSHNSYTYRIIDWNKVANQFDGIIIAPYQWEMRLDFDYGWYYTWDCASGCVWKNEAIQSIEFVEEIRLCQPAS